jgi:hypothetical protein
VSSPTEVPVQLNVTELLDAQSNLAAQQVAALMRRNAELEATVLALRRMLAEATDATPHPRPKAVGGD